MKKRIFTFLLAATMAFPLAGCTSESTSTSTVTTSVTDENGTTTETTTTRSNENGEETVEETTTVTDADGNESSETIVATADDPTGLRKVWDEYFNEGAEGQTEQGEHVYFIFDEGETFSAGAMMILNNEEDTLLSYDFGNITVDDDGWWQIEDVEGEDVMPFVITSAENEKYFEIEFQDGDYAKMYYVSKEKIIDDMITIWENTER